VVQPASFAFVAGGTPVCVNTMVVPVFAELSSNAAME
jgi:hypothetical protein